MNAPVDVMPLEYRLALAAAGSSLRSRKSQTKSACWQVKLQKKV